MCWTSSGLFFFWFGIQEKFGYLVSTRITEGSDPHFWYSFLDSSVMSRYFLMNVMSSHQIVLLQDILYIYFAVWRYSIGLTWERSSVVVPMLDLFLVEPEPKFAGGSQLHPRKINKSGNKLRFTSFRVYKSRSTVFSKFWANKITAFWGWFRGSLTSFNPLETKTIFFHRF